MSRPSSCRIDAKASRCEECPSRGESVFCQLEAAALEQLDRDKNTNAYKKGQNLFVEGNPPFGFYCISSGKVKLSKSTESGKEVLLRIAGPGEVLGHRSLFSEQAYNATATAMEDTHVCFVSRPAILKLIEQNPQLTVNLLKRLGDQMGAAENRLVAATDRSVRERVAETLVVLAETYGLQDADRIRVDLSLTRDELSGLVGAATENVIRVITEFKKDGIIDEHKKQFMILDVEALSEVASRDGIFLKSKA